MQHPTLSPILGCYRLIAELSRGRSGFVYEARHVTTHQRVVVKLFPISHALDMDAAKRFETEITILSRLKHPGIPSPIEQGSDQGFSYFVLPWIAGCTLRDLCRLDPIEPKLGARLIRDAAKAIGHAHDLGVIHRDIKAENLMLDQDSHIHVLDFGISHLASQHGSTQAGDLLGTPYAMSPEQASGNPHSLDLRSDIYSLGVVLYYLLTTREPIRGRSPQDLLNRIPRASIRNPRRINANVPRALDTICMRCLEKNRIHRYVSTGELTEDLDRFLAGRPILSHAKSLRRIAVEFCQFNPLAAISIACLMLIAASFLWILLDFRKDAIDERQYAGRLKAYTLQLTQQAEQERQLKEQANHLKNLAIDNEAKALEENTQGILLRAENRILEKDFLAARETISEIQANPKLKSIDSEWTMLRIGSAGYHEIAMLMATSDRGLYDSCVSPNGAFLATVDRGGEVSVWDLATEQLLHRFTEVPLDPYRLIPYTRWHYLFDQDRGITLPKTPLFFSSLDWLDSQRFLVGGCDGTLYEANLNAKSFLPLFTQPDPIQHVRLDTDRKSILLASANGMLRRLDHAGKIVNEYAGSSASSFLQYLPECSTWCLADQSGKLVFLTPELHSIYEHSFSSKIHDIEIVSTPDSLRLLVVEHQQPIREFRIQTSPSFRLELERTLPIIPSLVKPSYEQVVAVPSEGLLVAIDQLGTETHWSYPQGKLQENLSRVSRYDRRPPSDSEREASDPLEARTRWKLQTYKERLTIIDCMGTFCTFEPRVGPPESPWQQLELQLGSKASIAMDAKQAHLGWAINQELEICVFDSLQDRILAKHPDAHSGHSPSLQLLSSGEAITAGHDLRIKRWSWTGDAIELKEEYQHQHPLKSVAVHEGKGLVASVSAHAELVIWKLGYSQPSHIIDLVPFQPDISAEVARKNILTGRLAFSLDGDLLAVSGPVQFFEVFHTSDFTRRALKHRQIAGRGCVDVCFSPFGNDRFLSADTNGPYSNCVLLGTESASSINDNLGAQILIKQIIASRDSQRILTLADHEIAFFTSQHFVRTYSIPPPTNSPASFALAASDSAILVNDEQGRLFKAMIDANVPHSKELQVEGTASWITAPGEWGQIDRVGLQGIAIEENPKSPPVMAISTQANPNASRILHQLTWNGNWELQRVPIPILSEKPVDWLTIHRTPDNRLHFLIRHKPIEGVGYEGGILSAVETKKNEWEVEKIQEGGNSGFVATPIYDYKGKLDSILHFDYNGQKLGQSKRGRVGEAWQWQGIRGAAGWGMNGVRLTNGKRCYLMRRSRGFDALPSLFAECDQENRLHFENAKGQCLLATQDDRLFSWDMYTQKLFHRASPGTWVQIPLPKGGAAWTSIPFLDNQDRLWLANHRANCVLVRMIDLSSPTANQADVEPKWKQVRILLEKNVPASVFLLAVPTAQGSLELLLASNGQEGSLLRITTPNPFD